MLKTIVNKKLGLDIEITPVHDFNDSIDSHDG